MKNLTHTYRLALMLLTAFAASACHAGQKTPKPAPASRTANVSTAKAGTGAKDLAVVYKCPDCKDTFTEVQAKKAGMKCACCQTKLVRNPQPRQKGKPSVNKTGRG